ncbi:MAG: SAM-dependent methyltransferase [Syntrophobacterales bacterium]
MRLIFFTGLTTILVLVGTAWGGTDRETQGRQAMSSAPDIQVNPIGTVTSRNDRAVITIRPELAAALEGLEGFSHVWVIFWFHENDRLEQRAILQVHPRRDPSNPLTGVFATRAPMRPNLIGLTCCRILRRRSPPGRARRSGGPGRPERYPDSGPQALYPL